MTDRKIGAEGSVLQELCHFVIMIVHILTYKRNATTKILSCFIQAVILSNYVEINQQKLLAMSCFEGISNFVQWYIQTGVNQG